MDLSQLTIEKTHQGLKKKEFSAKELCQAYLDKIEEKNKDIFAFLTVTREEALLQAERVDKLIATKGEIPLLAGVPIAIKDNILVQDIKCTAASKILENYIAPYDATVIKKLKEQQVVILGKTNLDEFAMGSSCEYSAFGPTKNPCDLERVPGGSSGGSAAAVASQMALASLGSDTGGSVRQPASFCGVVGLKPTYGRVSRYGLIAMASSLDQIGPITKCVEDAKIVFDAISGRDPFDSTSVEFQLSTLNFQLSTLKIGVPKEYFIKGMNSEVEKLVNKAIKKFEDLGAKIEEISLPHTEYALAVYYILMPSEVSANLARYDGIKFGMSIASSEQRTAENLLDVYLYSRKEGFGDEIKRRIMLGTFALSHGYYEAYYLRAQKVRTKIKQDFERAFKKVDLILTPVAPGLPFKFGEKTRDPIQMYLEDVLMVPANLAGLPALSVPCSVRNVRHSESSKTGHIISDGACGKIDNLPVGFQIIGNVFEENKILKAGEIYANS